MPSAKRYLAITNNFLHDMATGTWAACLLVLVVLSARLPGLPDAAAVVIHAAMWSVFWLLAAALIVLTATGAARLVYWRRESSPEELVAKRRALIVKHIAFIVIYGAGTAWAWTLVS